MAVPRLDPRVTKDRVFEYGEYKVLSAQFGRSPGRTGRMPKAGGWIGTDTVARRRSSVSFAVLIGVAIAVVLASAAFAAWLEADSLRLSYVREDLRLASASLDQTLSEAVSDNLARESRLLAGAGAQQGVAYPAQTKYVVLTNIPVVSSSKLVADLYPLSRGLVRIDP